MLKMMYRRRCGRGALGAKIVRLTGLCWQGTIPNTPNWKDAGGASSNGEREGVMPTWEMETVRQTDTANGYGYRHIVSERNRQGYLYDPTRLSRDPRWALAVQSDGVRVRI